ncbi:MAG TPA: hypothetical protein PK640_07085 [Verrucomicrobiota bacterium]|nr:hypothetical protein [Verrucomicrobiota bacterium]
MSTIEHRAVAGLVIGVLCAGLATGWVGAAAEMTITTNSSLTVSPGVEHVVALSSTNVVNQWGPWQFPAIDRLPDGRLHVWFSSGLNSAVDYGKEAHFVSSDEGKSWQRTERQHGG